MAMQTHIRMMLITVIRLVHDETSATAAEARKSAAGEILRENRLAWKARGVLADDEAAWAPRRPQSSMRKDTTKAL
jgi:hypothetical protein